MILDRGPKPSPRVLLVRSTLDGVTSKQCPAPESYGYAAPVALAMASARDKLRRPGSSSSGTILGGAAKPDGTTRTARERRRERRNDPFRQHRAVMGKDARISWPERVRALLLLMVMVLILGAAVAGFIGLLFFVGTLLIDILAG